MTVALGGAALAGSVALLVPAAQTVPAATTPIGPLRRTINTPAQRSYVYDRSGNVMTTLFERGPGAGEARATCRRGFIDAVLSIEDRKFYEHNGVDYAGTYPRTVPERRTRARSSRVGRRSPSSSSRTRWAITKKRDLKTKVREAVSRDPARERAHEEPDPRGLPEPRVLRQRRVRRPGRGRALLQRARARLLTLGRGGAARGLDPVARRRSTRSRTRPTPPAGAPAVLDAMIDTKVITAEQARAAARSHCRRRP